LTKTAAVIGAGLLVFIALSLSGGGRSAEAASYPGQVQMTSASDVCYVPTSAYCAYSSFYYSDTTCISSCTGFATAFLGAVCSAPPAQIYPTSTISTSTCGNNENLSFQVLNTYGIGVIDGTKVTFTTTLGLVTPSAMTNAGNATASLMIPPKQAGVATVTATAGGVSVQQTVNVSCGTAAAPAPVYTAPAAPVYTAPSTTSGGYSY
jgi:hypothetical protein